MTPYIQLRTFLETIRSGSVSKAAKILGLSQPAASAHIQSLEAMLDSPLFLRHARGVTPTSIARDLNRQISKAMDQVEEEFSSFQARAQVTGGPIHIVGPGEFMRAHMPCLLTRLGREGFRPRLEIGGQEVIYDRLLSGKAELAITASEPMSDQIDFEPLYTETLMPVATPQWIEDHQAYHVRQALTGPLLAYDFDLPLVRTVLAGEGIKEAHPVPSVLVPDLDMLRSLVLQGDGWTVLPDYMIAEDLLNSRLQLLQTDEALPVNDINLAWLKSSLQHPRIARARLILCQSLT